MNLISRLNKLKDHDDTDQSADDIDINDYFGGRDDDEGLGL